MVGCGVGGQATCCCMDMSGCVSIGVCVHVNGITSSIMQDDAIPTKKFLHIMYYMYKDTLLEPNSNYITYTPTCTPTHLCGHMQRNTCLTCDPCGET